MVVKTFITRHVKVLKDLQGAEDNRAAAGRGSSGDAVAAVRNGQSFALCDFVACQIIKRDNPRLRLQRSYRALRNLPGIKRIRTLLRNGLQRIRVPLPGNNLPLPQQRSIRRKINRPRGVVFKKIVALEGFSEVGVDGKSVACKVDGGLEEVFPGEGSVFSVEVFKAADLAGDASGLSGVEGGRVGAVYEDRFVGCCGCGLPEVDEVVVARGGAD